MRIAIAILFVLTASGAAWEARHFYGAWSPPTSLLEFWAPIDNGWLIEGGGGASPKLKKRCHEFSMRWKPEAIIPDMIADLRADPSEVRWFVYLFVMQNWPKDRVLRILTPFQHSKDPAVAHIADEFYADTE